MCSKICTKIFDIEDSIKFIDSESMLFINIASRLNFPITTAVIAAKSKGLL